MHQPLFFFRSGRSLARNFWCFLMLFLSIAFSCLLFFTPPVHGAQTHGCAPDTPPTVPGNPSAPPTRAGIIVINEVLTNPASGWNCSDLAGKFSPVSDSWIELYNPQNLPFNLYLTHTQISIDGGTNWYQLPFGTSIDAYGYLVLFPNEKLPAATAWNVMLAMGSTLIDSIKISALEPDQSYARTSNGSIWSITDQPTIDASNDTPGQTATTAPTLTSIALTQTPQPTGTSTGGGSNGGSAPTGLGTQPAWNQVNLPPGASPTTVTATRADVSTPPSSSQFQNPPAAQNGGSHNWQVALVITFVLLLLGALAWCWRLFRAP